MKACPVCGVSANNAKPLIENVHGDNIVVMHPTGGELRAWLVGRIVEGVGLVLAHEDCAETKDMAAAVIALADALVEGLGGQDG